MSYKCASWFQFIDFHQGPSAQGCNGSAYFPVEYSKVKDINMYVIFISIMVSFMDF